MTSDSIDWTQEAELDPEKEYRALVRSIRYSRGFSLLFVQCSPAEGKRLIERVREDLPKKIEVLTLRESIDNLYDVVDALPNKDQIDALFIEGIERSLYAYEKEQLWQNSSEQRNYSQKSIPRLLGHLNLGRERFRDRFKFCFIFLVPQFVLKYLTRRAPDFFDWRSGVLELSASPKNLQRDVRQFLSQGNYDTYRSLSSTDRTQKILEIQAWLDEQHLLPEYTIDLLFEQLILRFASGEFPSIYEEVSNREAIQRFDELMEASESSEFAILSFLLAGIFLCKTAQQEKAIISFDKVLNLEPTNIEAWLYRGLCLSKLGQDEEAIASYDRALILDADLHAAWNIRGSSLAELERYEEAIASYDRALAIKPDFDQAWYNRGISLEWLERYEEAIASYNKSLEFFPNDADAFYNKAYCYGLQGKVDEVIEQLKQAIDLNTKYRDMAKTDSDFDSIRNDDRFQALINENQNE